MQPCLEKLRDHLISKNVAADIAVKLCDSVATKLEGRVSNLLHDFINFSTVILDMLDVLFITLSTNKSILCSRLLAHLKQLHPL